jgi:hypothetical protein
MFSEVDKSIFPDSCEVLEIVPSQLFVYPIFKNGSTSLLKTAPDVGWKIIDQHQIPDITQPITVFLRDPRERFISGVNTFVQQSLRDRPELDTNTILFFVEQYLFLNRHYAPQFFWLINLARFSHAPLKFRHIQDVSELTPLNHRASIVPPTPEFLASIQNFPWQKLELYFSLDQLLMDRIGQQMTFDDLINSIKQTHRYLYDLIFDHTSHVYNVLPKT